MHWILLLIAIECEAFASAAMKLTDGLTRPLPTIGVLAGYLVAFPCYAIAVRTISVSIAYALWSGLGMILVAAAGWLYYGQKLDTAAVIGLAFIIAGIVIIHLFSKSVIN